MTRSTTLNAEFVGIYQAAEVLVDKAGYAVGYNSFNVDPMVQLTSGHVYPVGILANEPDVYEAAKVQVSGHAPAYVAVDVEHGTQLDAAADGSLVYGFGPFQAQANTTAGSFVSVSINEPSVLFVAVQEISATLSSLITQTVGKAPILNEFGFSLFTESNELLVVE